METIKLANLALRFLLEVCALAALYSAEHPNLAWALALAYAANRALIYAWGQ
jgi:hypothetical protein